MVVFVVVVVLVAIVCAGASRARAVSASMWVGPPSNDNNRCVCVGGYGCECFDSNCWRVVSRESNVFVTPERHEKARAGAPISSVPPMKVLKVHHAVRDAIGDGIAVPFEQQGTG